MLAIGPRLAVAREALGAEPYAQKTGKANTQFVNREGLTGGKVSSSELTIQQPQLAAEALECAGCAPALDGVGRYRDGYENLVRP